MALERALQTEETNTERRKNVGGIDSIESNLQEGEPEVSGDVKTIKIKETEGEPD
jgi:hypothetical protein